MKTIEIYIIVALTLVVFYLLFFTENPVENGDKKIIDSLIQINNMLDVENKKLDDSVSHYMVLYDSSFRQATKEQSVKYIYRTKYEKDTAYNHSISSLQRDSIIRAVFLKK